MKFCPYCGADILDGTVSFCSECGKALPGEQKEENLENLEKPEKPKPESDKKKPKKKKPPKKKQPKKRNTKAKPDAEPEEARDDGYDGYYDDILPVDEGREREGMDKGLVKKVVLIIVGVLLVVAACVAIMYLL